jgi:hypothetical protein
MYTPEQVQAVIAYNAQHNIFRKSAGGRILWDLRNIDVANLRLLGVTIAYAEHFAALKQQVKRALQA